MTFVNAFDLLDIRRFYTIHPRSTDVIRAWQGHQIESKWFYCLRGSFIINLVEIDDWQQPSLKLTPISFQLDVNKSEILYIPPGYANGFMATTSNSSLLIFSDTRLEQSTNDDFRFDANLWFDWQTKRPLL